MFDSYECPYRSVWIVSERKRCVRLQILGPAAGVWRRWHCAALAPGMRTEGTDNIATVAAVMKRGAEALLAVTLSASRVKAGVPLPCSQGRCSPHAVKNAVKTAVKNPLTRGRKMMQ